MVHERAESDQQIGERRRHLRYAETNRVLFVEVAHAGETYAGHLRDLSVGGLCLVTSREVSVGTRLCLGIFFEHESDPLIVLARVRRCSPEEDGFFLGLEFLRTTNTQRKALRHVARYLVERHGG
jgi:hypothetical protein